MPICAVVYFMQLYFYGLCCSCISVGYVAAVFLYIAAVYFCVLICSFSSVDYHTAAFLCIIMQLFPCSSYSVQLHLCPVNINGCGAILIPGGAIELTLTRAGGNSSNSTDCNSTNTSGSNPGRWAAVKE